MNAEMFEMPRWDRDTAHKGAPEKQKAERIAGTSRRLQRGAAFNKTCDLICAMTRKHLANSSSNYA